jgi:hypothetical protein
MERRYQQTALKAHLHRNSLYSIIRIICSSFVTWWDGMDWIDPAQDRDQWRALVNIVMNLRVPSHAGKFLSVCTIDSFSRRAHNQVRK